MMRSRPRWGSASQQWTPAARSPASTRTVSLTVISTDYGASVHKNSQASGARVGPLFQSEHPGIRPETKICPAGTVHPKVAELVELRKAPDIVRTDSYAEYVQGPAPQCRRTRAASALKA
ncbi:hypothetical protein [Streptomyces cavernae]|uniref:hypothetical protein n=1 Tax=Streptomyces cavernae TaxID=2259034 RepID=UPI000FEB7BBD|nr:hypothetical protein [Streptomyces cavernae]